VQGQILGASPRLSPDDIGAGLAFAAQVLHADLSIRWLAPQDGAHKGITPGADLYAVNVCSSVSTARNGEATLLGLDRVTDPSGDLDLSHAAELVSLPLGSSYSQCADDSTRAVSNAVRFGIVAAISAGYSADQPLHRRPLQQHRTVLLGCAAVGAGFSGEGHSAIQAGQGDSRACTRRWSTSPLQSPRPTAAGSPCSGPTRPSPAAGPPVKIGGPNTSHRVQRCHAPNALPTPWHFRLP
jgi:hypothetical protein